ncbi:coadhesin-like [Amphiura filiformis]|uniref:coadhesin-like n=1 Tax=Amphiura filiformis TaxID=82378 RepID=UPI003B20CA14
MAYSRILLVLLQIVAVFGYPSGPPTDVCESQLPNHGGSPLNSNSPVTLTVTPTTYQSGSTHQVTVSGGPFKGFFVQARRQDSSSNQAIGQFGSPPADTKLLHCSPGSSNGWVHSNNELKSPSRTITWIAPSTNEGPIRFRTPIVQIYNTTSGENIYWAPDVTTSALLTYSQSTTPEWSEWGSWGSCSLTCGSGVQYRSRSCTDLDPSDAYNTCSGSTMDDQDCNTQVCPDPVWSSWSVYTVCTATCGTGTQYRTRECTDPYSDDEPECERGAAGEALGREPRDCNTQDCPVATWGQWTPFVGCTRTCGGGTQRRTRTCEDPDDTDNDVCIGVDSENPPCNTQPCPGFIAGEWGEWGDWSACSELCDAGLQTRRRLCSPQDSCFEGGAPVQTETCFIRACDGNELEWNEWSNWGSCSETCGLGQRQRVRTCEDPIERDDRCYGDSVETEACNDRCCDCGDVSLENLIWIIVGIVVFFGIVGAIAAAMCVCARAGFRPRNRQPKGLIALDLPPQRIARRPYY